MKYFYHQKVLAIAAFLFLFVNFSGAQTAQRSAKTVQATAAKTAQIEERNVRAEMNFLAGDALQGRGSGTQFEWLAAQYIGSQLQQFGVEPAGETDASSNKTYLQTVNITRNSFAEPPKLSYAGTTLEYGKEMVVYQISTEKVSGGLQKIKSGVTPKSGAILFVRAEDEKAMQNMDALAESAAAVIIEENPQRRTFWDRLVARKVSYTSIR